MDVHLSNTTLSNNKAAILAGGLYAISDTVYISNSIIVNSLGGNCFNHYANNPALTVDFNSIVERDLSLIGDDTCGAMFTAAPGLFTIVYNGGLTLTHALSANSIARDKSKFFGATPFDCTAQDQRGQLRNEGPSDLFCDRGAIEFSPDDISENTDDDTNFIVTPLGKFLGADFLGDFFS